MEPSLATIQILLIVSLVIQVVGMLALAYLVQGHFRILQWRTRGIPALHEKSDKVIDVIDACTKHVKETFEEHATQMGETFEEYANEFAEHYPPADVSQEFRDGIFKLASELAQSQRESTQQLIQAAEDRFDAARCWMRPR